MVGNCEKFFRVYEVFKKLLFDFQSRLVENAFRIEKTIIWIISLLIVFL